DEDEIVVGVEPDEPGNRGGGLAHARRAAETFGVRIGELPQQEARRLALDLVLQRTLVIEHRARRRADGAVVEVGHRGVAQPAIAERSAERGWIGHAQTVWREGKPDPAGYLLPMAVTVRIPTTLRPLSGGNKLVEVEAGTLSEVIAGLDAQHNGFADRL